MEWTVKPIQQNTEIAVQNIDLGFLKLTVQKQQLGDHILLTVTGGKAHIGCVVLSEPRQSLHRAEEISCTSSVLNRTGHKDEEICRCLAEKAAKKYNTAVVCTGGVHLDDISPVQIELLIKSIQAIEL